LLLFHVVSIPSQLEIPRDTKLDYSEVRPSFSTLDLLLHSHGGESEFRIEFASPVL